MKGVIYAKTLTKFQVRGIFRIRDIRRNVLPKFIEISWRRHAGAHPDELQHGGQKPTETSVTEFCRLQKREFIPRRTHKHQSNTFSNT